MYYETLENWVFEVGHFGVNFIHYSFDYESM